MKKDKEKLLIIGPIPPPFSGPEIGTRNLLNANTLRSQFEVLHVNTSGRKSNTDRGIINIDIIWSYFKYILNLLKTLIVLNPDVVLYTPTSATRMGWIRDSMTIYFSKMFGKRVYAQFRGGHFDFFYESLKPLGQNIIKSILRKCTKIIVQAEVLKNQFSMIVPNQKIDVLHNFIDNEFLEYFENIDRNRDSGPIRILFIGHLSFAKGYCDLLTTVPNVAEHCEVKYVVVGSLPGKSPNIRYNQRTGEKIDNVSADEYYKKYVRSKGLENCVQYRGGDVQASNKINLFERADIFVLPSYSEGFSMAVLEAMAAGLPIITTKVGALPEVLTHGTDAILIEPGDTDGLTSALIALADNSNERNRLGRAARAACERRFTEETICGRLLSILKE